MGGIPHTCIPFPASVIVYQIKVHFTKFSVVRFWLNRVANITLNDRHSFGSQKRKASCNGCCFSDSQMSIKKTGLTGLGAAE